jgi:uncharacterized protein Veg
MSSLYTRNEIESEKQRSIAKQVGEHITLQRFDGRTQIANHQGFRASSQ